MSRGGFATPFERARQSGNKVGEIEQAANEEIGNGGRIDRLARR
jgi:hypothetical protein